MLNLSSLIVPGWFIEAKKAGLPEAEIMKQLQAYGHEIVTSQSLYDIGAVEVPDESWVEAMYALYSEYYEQSKV